RPGYWAPQDWSPDGKRLLLHCSDFTKGPLSQEGILELDLVQVERAVKNAPPFRRWQRTQDEALTEVLGKAAPVEPNNGRCSTDGTYRRVTAVRKLAKREGWKALDFELALIDRATTTYRKVAHYDGGLRGPICWSPDGSEILFSRPLKAGDKREGYNGDG